MKNIEDYLAKKGERLPARAKSPWSSMYRPENDVTPELSSTEAAYFNHLLEFCNG